MKKISLMLVLISMCVLTKNSYAQDNDLNGFYVVGSSATSVDGSSTGVSGLYWSDYVGAQFGLRYLSSTVEAEGTDIIDENAFGIGASILGGIPLGSIKPYISLGLSYLTLKDDINDIEGSEISLNSSLGVDYAASERILIGIDIVNLTTALDAEIESGGATADISGTNVNLLSGFRIGYKF